MIVTHLIFSNFILSEVFENLLIDDKVKASGTIRGKLPHDDVFSDTSEHVCLSENCSLVENLDSLLERTLA